MDYFAAFDISASGMAVQKARLDAVAMNLANANTTRGVGGGPYRPVDVVIGERSVAFETAFSAFGRQLAGAEVLEVRPRLDAVRREHRPSHPDADADGFVSLPDINPVSEMVQMMEATRAYEANVRAANAARVMAQRALEIGAR
jgi:flagellar basal-body rod protein FlgC